MRLLIILLCLSTPVPALADFDLSWGLSVNAGTASKPEVDLPGPLGILRIEYETERETVIFCEHISSIPLDEQGNGLNHCGFMMKL